MGATKLWIRQYHEAPRARASLLCFPHAGGSATSFLHLSKVLSPHIAVAAVQYPGRQDRRAETPLSSATTLADQISDVVADWVDRPCAIFGHSMGAVVGYEVARRLISAGGAVPALFVSGRRAPHLPAPDRVHTMADEQIISELRLLNGTQRQVLEDEELVRMALPAIRADYRAIETYQHVPRPPLDVPIHAFVGRSDPRVAVADVEPWAAYTTAEFTLSTFPGGHFYLAEAQPALAAAITAVLTPRRNGVL